MLASVRLQNSAYTPYLHLYRSCICSSQITTLEDGNTKCPPIMSLCAGRQSGAPHFGLLTSGSDSSSRSNTATLNGRLLNLTRAAPCGASCLGDGDWSTRTSTHPVTTMTSPWKRRHGGHPSRYSHHWSAATLWHGRAGNLLPRLA